MAYASDGGGGGGDSRPPFQRRPDLFSDLMDRSGDNRAALKRLGADDELLDWLYGGIEGAPSSAMMGAVAPGAPGAYQSKKGPVYGGAPQSPRFDPNTSLRQKLQGYEDYQPGPMQGEVQKAFTAMGPDDLEKIFALFGLKR